MGELRGGKVGFAVAFALLPFFEEGEGELWLGGVVAWGSVGWKKLGGGRGGKREKEAEHARGHFRLTAN